MASHAPITGAPLCAPFDPAAWLSGFEAVGGGYTITDRLSLVYQIEGRSQDDQRRAAGMIRALTEEQRRRLVAHLCGGEG